MYVISKYRYQYMRIIPSNQLLVKPLLKQYYIPVCVCVYYSASISNPEAKETAIFRQSCIS